MTYQFIALPSVGDEGDTGVLDMSMVGVVVFGVYSRIYVMLLAVCFVSLTVDS